MSDSRIKILFTRLFDAPLCQIGSEVVETGIVSGFWWRTGGVPGRMERKGVVVKR
jgi:hypothetical protein